MNDERMPARPRFRDWALILAVFAAAVFGAAWLTRTGTRATNLAAAIVITAGTATIAAMTRRYSRLPRWATAVTVGLFGASAIGGTLLWPQSAAWHHAIKDSLWMHPWYVMTLSGAVCSPCGGACGPGSRTFAWVVIGVAFFVAVLVPAIATLI